MQIATGVSLGSFRYSGLVPRDAPVAVPECRLLNRPSSTEQCAEWFLAKRFTSCRNCKTGQANAHEPTPPSNHACVRCGRTEWRLVLGAYCTPCYNRNLELFRGRNGKNEWPRATAAVTMRFSALVKTQPIAIAAHQERLLRRRTAAPRTPTFARIDAEHVLVEAFCRDVEELNRLLARLLGECETVDIDSRQVLQTVGAATG